MRFAPLAVRVWGRRWRHLSHVSAGAVEADDVAEMNREMEELFGGAPVALDDAAPHQLADNLPSTRRSGLVNQPRERMLATAPTEAHDLADTRIAARLHDKIVWAADRLVGTECPRDAADLARCVRESAEAARALGSPFVDTPARAGDA